MFSFPSHNTLHPRYAVNWWMYKQKLKTHKTLMGADLEGFTTVEHAAQNIGNGRKALGLLRESKDAVEQPYAFPPTVQLQFEKTLFEQREELLYAVDLAKDRGWEAPRFSTDLMGDDGLMMRSRWIAR